MINKIKFSHNYPKLWNQSNAVLVAIRTIDAQAVSINKDLIEYDTKHEEGYYELPKTGRLIQLIFVGNKEIPFCTLRSYTPEKYIFYQKTINECFNIGVEK